MTTKTVAVEEDIRLKMLNTFMSCTHRDTDAIKDIHKELQEADPVFYSHLACWYRKNGELRDHNEVFTAALITDPYMDNREVGIGLFQDHALFMKRKIVGFIKGKKVKIRNKTGKKIVKAGKKIDEVEISEKIVGLLKNVPNSLKTDITRYLRWLESDNTRFDAATLKNHEDLKFLFASMRVKPSKRANDILFKGEIPADSKLKVLEKIAKSTSARDIASLIAEHKVPYTTAIGLVDNITPTVLAALVNSMSPQEVINNIASLEEKGAFNNADLKSLIDSKLDAAKKSKSVSTLKSKTAKATGRITNEAIAQKLDDVADAQVKSRASIGINTAVFVDASSSMEAAIEIGKKVAALISGSTSADLFVVSFDNMPREIKAKGKMLSDWEKAFSSVRAQGYTSIGCALELLRRNKSLVDQIVIITDEEENSHPLLKDAYKLYAQDMKVNPNIIIINPKSPALKETVFSATLKQNGVNVERYSPAANDYYGLPGLIPLLSHNSKLDLLLEIMDTPLSVRKDYK